MVETLCDGVLLCVYSQVVVGAVSLLKISHVGGIYTKEIGKCYISVLGLLFGCLDLRK